MKKAEILKKQEYKSNLFTKKSIKESLKDIDFVFVDYGVGYLEVETNQKEKVEKYLEKNCPISVGYKVRYNKNLAKKQIFIEKKPEQEKSFWEKVKSFWKG